MVGAYRVRMDAWTWRYEATDGSVMDDPALPRHTFPSQADAEAWVGETWRELAAAGVESVSLLHDDKVVYAAMSLRPVE